MHNEETKKKIGDALRRPVSFNCDYCGNESVTNKSAYNKKERHFCSRWCYSQFRKYCLPREEQHAYKGGGEPEEIKAKKVKARSDLNHAIRDGKIKRMPCRVCGDLKSEAHHDDYKKPFNVKWLCFKHHREYHEHGNLLKGDSDD